MNELSDIVEIPTLMKSDGTLVVHEVDLLKFSDALLQTMAEQLGCKVVYIKHQATYAINDRLCIRKGCWRPSQAGHTECDDHVH